MKPPRSRGRGRCSSCCVVLAGGRRWPCRRASATTCRRRRRRRDARRRWRPLADPAARLDRAAAAPDLGDVLLPGARLGAVPRASFECATLTVPVDYADPGGETIEPRAAQGPGRRPRRARRLAGGQPRRPGRARHRLRRAAPAARSATAADRPLRHRRLRPARHRRLRPGRLPLRRASSTPTSPPTPTPTRPRRRPSSATASTASGPGCVANSGEPGRATSPPSRPPATWTCCAPRSARRR